MRILLVEDDDIVATGVEEALRREGYSVDHCRSAEDALPALEVTGYDLAIVDIGLQEWRRVQNPSFPRGAASTRAAPSLNSGIRRKWKEQPRNLEFPEI